MKKILLLIFLFFSFIAISFANQVDFYWEKQNQWNINVSELNTKLENFYKKTGLNTDIIILWKNDECYLENNFDSCVQKNKVYSSDLLIILSMKSDIKSKWDIRTLIKDEFKESITPRELKNLQDQIIYNFKNQNFTKWLSEYLWLIDSLIFSKCNEIWTNFNCDAVKLAKKYHSYIAEQEDKKAHSAFMKNIYYLLFIIWIVLWWLWWKKFYTNRINYLFKDVKYKKVSINDYKLFEKDKEEIAEKLDILEWILEAKLWDLDKNVFSLRKFYNQNKQKYNQLEENIKQIQNAFLEKEEIQKQVEQIKNINL
jgi:hypothetical protein